MPNRIHLARNGGLSTAWAIALKHVDAGSIRGRLIYMHFTDAPGFQAITVDNQLNGRTAGVLRPGASPVVVHLSPSSQRFSPEEVWDQIFINEPAYINRGQYVFIIALQTHSSFPREIISKASSAVEVKYGHSINLIRNELEPLKENDALVLYSGRNRFEGDNA